MLARGCHRKRVNVALDLLRVERGRAPEHEVSSRELRRHLGLLGIVHLVNELVPKPWPLANGNLILALVGSRISLGDLERGQPSLVLLVPGNHLDVLLID